MSWKTLKPLGREVLGCDLAYSIVHRQKQLPKLCLSICAKLMRQAGLKDWVRLDVDVTRVQARLLAVASTHLAKRIDTPSSTGRGWYRLTWSGEVQTLFPEVEAMTTLQVLEATQDAGLVFELPIAAKPKGEHDA